MKNLKNNNKGFSLVELIVVIAIMVVLAVALAPVFTKFVGQSRRATDVANANTLAEAILVEVADNPNASTFDATHLPSTVKSWPVPQGKVGNDGPATAFVATYDASNNQVKIEITVGSNTYNLADPKQAQNYKDEKAPNAT